MSKSNLKLLRKEDYEFVKQFQEQFETSLRVNTMIGYNRNDLSKLEFIYKKYDGVKTHSFSSCSACAFKIMKALLYAVKEYEDRYFNRGKDTEDASESTEIAETTTDTTETTNDPTE